jgi:hypothetical protein
MGEENPDEVGLSVSAEQVVGDATTRRESWESLSRLIPGPDVVLVMPVVLPEESAALTSEEWALLALVDGERSVGAIVDLSGAGQFTVVSTLASLLQRGLLVLRDEDTPDHVEVVRRRQQLLAALEVRPAAEPVAADVPVASSPTTPPPPEPAAPAEPAGHVAGAPGVLPGAHAPAAVVPPRHEPFLPKREVDHPEPTRAPGFAAPSAPVAPAAPVPNVPNVPTASEVVPSAPPLGGATAGAVSGTAGVATAAAPNAAAAIERDPTVNRSLMLRLIAGVRGL